MLYPVELKYSKSHEWVKTEDGVTVVGISDFAQDALGDVVFVNLPAEGDTVTAGEPLFEIETDKVVNQIEATESGILKRQLVEEGDTVPVETAVAILEEN